MSLYLAFHIIERRPAKTMLPTEFFQWNSGFRLLQDIYDLAFRIPRLLHVDLSWLYFSMKYLLIYGPILGDGYQPAFPIL